MQRLYCSCVVGMGHVPLTHERCALHSGCDSKMHRAVDATREKNFLQSTFQTVLSTATVSDRTRTHAEREVGPSVLLKISTTTAGSYRVRPTPLPRPAHLIHLAPLSCGRPWPLLVEVRT